MKKTQYADYRALKSAGVEVGKTNSVEFNAGGQGETNAHLISKTLAAKVLLVAGYRVNSEVEIEDMGDVDILAWGHEDRLTYAVECETSPTDEVVEDKLERYVHSNDVVDDMLLLNVSDCPVDRIQAEAWVREELGL